MRPHDAADVLVRSCLHFCEPADVLLRSILHFCKQANMPVRSVLHFNGAAQVLERRCLISCGAEARLRATGGSFSSKNHRHFAP